MNLLRRSGSGFQNDFSSESACCVNDLVVGDARF
jgi:hypothetical protein